MPKPVEEKPKPRAPSPASVAAELLGDAMHFVTDDSDTVYRYTGAYWAALPGPTLRQIALEADGFRRSSSGRRHEIVEQVKARSHIPKLEWGRVADWEVGCANGVVDARTGELRPHRAEDFLEKIVPWDYRPGASAPHWLAALDLWFGSPDAAEIAALQEFFGYLILSHAKWKKALVVYGPSDCGKSIVPAVMERLVGKAQCCSLPLEQMDDPVARAVIMGKSLNIMTELAVDAMIADGGFKQLVSTEEPILINEKYKAALSYTPRAKHVFCTNALPRMTDRTEAVLNRLLLIPMKRVLKAEEQDKTLPAKLAAEMPGILAWAIEGAGRLVERGGVFVDVEAATGAIEEMRRDANPFLDFAQERLIPNEHTALTLSNLCDVFNKWNRGSRKFGVKAFGKLVRAAGKDYLVKKQRYSERQNVVCLVGFDLIAIEVEASFNITARQRETAAAQGDPPGEHFPPEFDDAF